MIKKRMLLNWGILALGVMLLVACGGTPEGGTFVWIDVPLDGLTFPDVQPINIEGHATALGGVEQVEIWIDGALLTTINNPTVEGTLARFSHEWIPPGEGEYIIQALSISGSGEASEADTARITIGEAPVSESDLDIVSVEAVSAGEKDGIPFCNTRVVYSNTGSEAIPNEFSIQFYFDGIPQETVLIAGGLAPGASTVAVFTYQFSDLHYIGINLDSDNVIAEINEDNNAFAEARFCAAASTVTAIPTLTPTVTITPTLHPTVTVSPTPEPVVNFWAEPIEITAGDCTTIRWHVENVSKVVFGGIEQPFNGSYQVCLCEDQTYPLTVTYLDNTEERRTVDIIVNGSCIPPTSPPPQDTTPPPVPTPAVPANGLTLTCRATQSLVWLPVDDDSGIAEYRVQVQRHSGDNNWQDVPGSVFSGISDKQMSVNVDCGWYYRWRVRAVDAAGNSSAWSGYWQFVISLE
jgi:hypothetical protein